MNRLEFILADKIERKIEHKSKHGGPVWYTKSHENDDCHLNRDTGELIFLAIDNYIPPFNTRDTSLGNIITHLQSSIRNRFSGRRRDFTIDKPTRENVTSLISYLIIKYHAFDIIRGYDVRDIVPVRETTNIDTNTITSINYSVGVLPASGAAYTTFYISVNFQ